MQSVSHILLQMLVYVPVILLAVIMHELGHAWVSVWLGDPTPRHDGRLTMNPLQHFDAGSLIFLLISGLFGGMFLVARPVRTAPAYYRFPIISELLVSMAGPCVNFLCAIVFWPLLMLLGSLIPFSGVYQVFFFYCLVGIKMNLYVGLFNLLPIPPLDGSYLWLSWFPHNRFAQFRENMNMYGMWFLLFLFVALLLIPNSLLRYLLLWVEHLTHSIVVFWKVIKIPMGSI